MFRRIEDFVQLLNLEAESTIKVWGKIPEQKKSDKVHANVRTLDRLAWHITCSNLEMLSRAGVSLSAHMDDQDTPPAMEEIRNIYASTMKEIADAVSRQWSNDELEQEVEMYGEMWSKGKVLYVVLGHQGHHRSQMTVIMRILGLEVPGTWGPSKEEWAAFSIPAVV